LPQLRFTKEAVQQLEQLENSPGQLKRYKAVRATLGKMERNLRHPGLNTHVYHACKCPHGEKLFEAYAENKTAAAYRIFFCYMPRPDVDVVLIVAITPHP
jgi:hypothetical protein